MPNAMSDPVAEFSDGVLSEHPGRLEGRRVLIVAGHEGGHPFTTGWYEADGHWVSRTCRET